MAHVSIPFRFVVLFKAGGCFQIFCICRLILTSHCSRNPALELIHWSLTISGIDLVLCTLRFYKEALRILRRS